MRTIAWKDYMMSDYDRGVDRRCVGVIHIVWFVFATCLLMLST